MCATSQKALYKCNYGAFCMKTLHVANSNEAFHRRTFIFPDGVVPIERRKLRLLLPTAVVHAVVVAANDRNKRTKGKDILDFACIRYGEC